MTYLGRGGNMTYLSLEREELAAYTMGCIHQLRRQLTEIRNDIKSLAADVDTLDGEGLEPLLRAEAMITEVSGCLATTRNRLNETYFPN